MLGRTLNAVNSTNSFDGPDTDFDLVAINSIEFGQTAFCPVDVNGGIDCTFLTFNTDAVATAMDLEEPTGTGNRDVSLNSSGSFGSGCFVNETGEIECFGPPTSTTPHGLGQHRQWRFHDRSLRYYYATG